MDNFGILSALKMSKLSISENAQNPKFDSPYFFAYIPPENFKFDVILHALLLGNNN